jgi:hypothetical protein
MAAQWQKNELRESIDGAFDTMSVQQLWAITKLCKFVRQRARNNAAFNNLMNELFPHARFRQVEKQKENGETYPGLEITLK